MPGLLRKIYDPVTMKSVITEYAVLYLFKLSLSPLTAYLLLQSPGMDRLSIWIPPYLLPYLAGTSFHLSLFTL